MFLLFIVPIIYIFGVLLNLPMIGIGWDTSVNLAKGEQVFRYLQFLDISIFTSTNFKSLYFNELPGHLNGHPTAFSLISFLLGNFFSQIFGFKFYFFHLANVIFSFVFMYFLGLFVFKLSKSKIYALFSQLIILGHPFFFLHSIVNVKDLPVLVFSFIAIVLVSEKGLLKNKESNYYFSLAFFILSIYSKFTALFLFPYYIYLLYKLKVKYDLLKIICSLLILIFLTFLFYPHIIFNFSEEIFRIFNVYLYLPSKAFNSASFLYFLFINTPTVLLIFFFLTFSSTLLNKKFRINFILWVFPSLFYLIFINRQYDALRQFLFLLVPFSVYSFLFFVRLKRFFSPSIINSMLIGLMLYFLLLFFLPLNQKIFYQNIVGIEPINDGWGLSVPLALDYINKNYNSGRLYYSPANFLLEYYPINKFEIIYQPEYSDIWIASRKTSSYVEEKAIREANYKLDTRFNISRGMLEIWVKK